MPAGSISIEDVVVEHRGANGRVRALDGVSFTVERGSSVAVIGPSGGGKSTLLGIIGGLARPTTGTVRIEGLDLSGSTERDLSDFRRRRLGFVYQSDNLLPFLTVIENLGLQVALGRSPTDTDRALELLDRLGLRAEADKLPDHLSGGQRQRVAVARAVVHRPQLILADEPTGALDAPNAAGVIDMLMGEQRAIGATLVMVTHDREAADRLDRQVELRDGRVR
ncbi:MAG TPA: ABC transporter ATP-binding protein [Microlunatus sp.]|nr:ABC transporter ATP-binding protein [Microlunatus sp.]